MTLVIGIKCVDSVILAGDRKVMRETECLEEKKIVSPFENFVLGYSGHTVYMDYLISRISDYSNIPNEKKAWKDFCNFLEDSTYELNKKYESRMNNLSFDTLFSVKLRTNSAYLFHLHIGGYRQKVKNFDIIGHGAPYALPFLRAVYSPEITMDQVIKLCIFILKLIDKCDVDTTVGGKPQIYQIPDNGDIKEVSEEEIDVLLKRTQVEDRLYTAIFKQRKIKG